MTCNSDLDEYAQGTTFVLTVAFFDPDSNPAEPSSATYNVDDAFTEASIIPVTSITPLGATVEITLDSTATVIIDPKNDFEEHVVTIVGRYGTGSDKVTREYRFRVRRLAFLPEE